MPNTYTAVEVIQADRDHAADAVEAYRGNKNNNWQARIRRGECDDGEMVQSFARHRIASTRTVDTELLEALKVAHEALCNHACHAGDSGPCIRSSDQCRADCGKQAGDAIVTVSAAITKAEG